MTTLAGKIAAASLDVGGKLAPDKRNNEQNYNYISADAIMSVCGQALASQGVMVFPTVTAEQVEIVTYTKGQYEKQRYDALVTFGMIVTDGETEMVAPWVGRGSDYAVPDKATYKAITSGHKYFMMKLLNVGAGNEDGEHDTQDIPDNISAGTRQHSSAAPTATSDNGVTEGQQKAIFAIGKKLYGNEWDAKRAALVKAVTKGRTDSAADLTKSEASRIIEGMKEKEADMDSPGNAPKSLLEEAAAANGQSQYAQGA